MEKSRVFRLHKMFARFDGGTDIKFDFLLVGDSRIITRQLQIAQKFVVNAVNLPVNLLVKRAEFAFNFLFGDVEGLHIKFYKVLQNPAVIISQRRFVSTL